MCRIINISPGGERALVVSQLGHDPEPTLWAEHLVKSFEFDGRMGEVFGGFGAGDEVVCLIEHASIGCVVGVVNGGRKPLLLEHYREGGTGAGTVVQPIRTRIEALDQRRGELVEKGPVTLVGRIVLVLVIVGSRSHKARVMLGVEKDQPAALASKKPLAADFGEPWRRSEITERTEQNRGAHFPLKRTS